MAGGPAPWGAWPGPFAARPRPRANAAAAVTAGVLALLTAAMQVWFALYNVVYVLGPDGGWSRVEVVNVLGATIAIGVLVVTAGFTFARRISGAWTLCVLCALYVVSTLFAAPLLFGTPLSTHLTFVFGFHKSNGVAVALTDVFGFLTAIMAAIAASVTSYGPATAPPPGQPPRAA